MQQQGSRLLHLRPRIRIPNFRVSPPTSRAMRQPALQITSLGGGTGSGLGSKVGELLADEYPRVYRFATAVCPSANDGVVTSPYNTILSLWKLIQNADCVLPVENQALIDICEKVALGTKKHHGHGMDDGDGFSRASRGNPSVIDSGKKTVRWSLFCLWSGSKEA